MLIAAIPPVVVDAAAGTARRVRVPGLGAQGRFHLVQLGDRAAAVFDALCGSCPPTDAVFLIGPDDRAAIPLGSAADVAQAMDRNAAWLFREAAKNRCTLTKVTLDGKTLRPARPIACGQAIRGSERSGFIVTRRADELLVDPATGLVRLRARQILAIQGPYVLTADSSGRMQLHSLASKRQFAVPSPSTLPFVNLGAPDPTGNRIAVSFADPSHGSPQLFDVWIFDVDSRRFTQMPSMPLGVELKFTSLTWTAAGEIVLLTRSRGRDVLVLWRPGRMSIRTRHIDIPARVPGSSAIAAWTPS